MTIESEILKLIERTIDAKLAELDKAEKPKAEKPKATKSKPKAPPADNVEKLNQHTVEDCQKLAREKMQAGVDKKDVKAAIDPDGRTLAGLTDDEIQAAYLRIKALGV